MTTAEPTPHTITQPTTTGEPERGSLGRGSMSYRTLAWLFVVGVALMVLQSLAYHHYAPKDGSVGSDVPVYVVSALIGCLIAAIGLFRVARSRRPATAPRVGLVLSILGLFIFPVAYFTPITFIWGATSYRLASDARPGFLRSAARVLGVVAMCLTPLVIVLRAVGVTYQLGG
jgi:hypothetical protein